MTTKKQDLDNSVMLYHIEQAQQSNFRVLSRITEDIIQRFFDLEEICKDNQEAMKIIDRINMGLLHALTQATYTGRALLSVPTDQRQQVKALLSLACELMPQPD